MRETMKKITISLLTLLFAHDTLSLDPRNPIALCDRFITVEEQKVCEKKIRTLQPDWYLAGICQHQYEDQNFYDCLGLSKKLDIPISKLHKCEDTDLNDEDRMSCLNKVITAKSNKVVRQPTSKKKSSTSNLKIRGLTSSFFTRKGTIQYKLAVAS